MFHPDGRTVSGPRISLLAICALSSCLVQAQSAVNRYALILEDSPAISHASSREAARSVEESGYRQQIEAKQQVLRAELTTRKFRVTGSVSTVANAVFVIASKDRVAELRGLPGVKGVVQLRRRETNLNVVAQTINAAGAWNVLGGFANGGAGMKIGILDTGIDNTHPAFQDSSLTAPSGFPVCDSLNSANCSSYTNSKVIVARSYTAMLAAGSDPGNPAADSRPDDYTPRDRMGHGTATASCATGAQNFGGVVSFSGMAPKAYLGNYKISGSTEVNGGTTDDVIIQALEDAYNDGMDVVSFSWGGPALYGPLDTGSTCGNSTGVACDLVAQTFNSLTQKGLIIVAAAGNDGYSGSGYPNYNSIESPGDAPGVITVGATTNGHQFETSVSVAGSGVPSSLLNITANPGDSYLNAGAVTAPLRDTASLGDAYACSTLATGSLAGTIALIERGTCNFSVKATNALNAGALAVIFYMADSSTPISPSGLSSVYIGAVMISNSDASAIKTYLAAHPTYQVTLDPNAIEVSGTADLLTGFSSTGPTIGDGSIKPDVTAPGLNIYMATQSLDPQGEMYSSTRYLAAAGTSFATPITAGVAALVKQAHPTYTPAQVKSALLNAASQTVTKEDYNGDPVDVRSLGGGRVDASASVQAGVTVVPASVSFGILTSGSLPKTQTLTLTNGGSSAVSLTIAAAATISGTATVAVDKTSLSLAAGATDTVTATLSGTVPSAGGAYYGAITITGTGVSLRVPYLYLKGDGVAANLFPLSGDNNDGTVSQNIPDGILSFKLTDQYGVPVSGASVSWSSRTSGGSIANADTVTDSNGIAAAEAYLGSAAGTYYFLATASGTRYTFTDYARSVPNIPSTGAIANAASWDTSTAVAPGSYITIGGTNLSDYTDVAGSATLPIAIDYAFVSFDVPSAGTCSATNAVACGLPGHLTFVSPTQINLQVPWELQGHTSAKVKVTIDYTTGNVVTLQLADYSPAFFEISSGAVAALDVSNNVISSSNPATRGQAVQLYANGLGPVTNQPASGAPALASPLSATTTTPVVTIGGQQATVLWSGLAPGYAGLYQINVTVPAGISAGNQTLVVSIGSKTSKTSGIVVK